MPFGYTKHMRSLDRSQSTINDYRKTIDDFFSYLDQFYGKDKEIHEIYPRDISGYLKNKREHGNSTQTVNKHLTILKGFFDYLWKEGKTPLDPTAKIERKVVTEERTSQITYNILLDLLPKVIDNPDYNTARKTVFILAMQSLRMSDFHMMKNDVLDQGDRVIIELKNRTVSLLGQDAEIFLTYYHDSLFNSSKYVFITKKHDDTIVPAEQMSIYMHLNAITKDYDLPEKITLNTIRLAYAYYLHKEKKLSVEEIANELGIKLVSAAALIRNSKDRYEEVKELLEKKS